MDALLTVAPDSLAQRLRDSRPPIVIDTLIEDHYERVHLPGAKSARVLEVGFLDQIRGITEDLGAEIVVYGSRAETADAPMAAEKLARAGYTNVAVLEGGLAAWRATGLPLEGSAPNASDTQASTPDVPDGTYSVDLEASRVGWAGRNPNSTHHGTVALARGALDVEGGVLRGAFEIDMTRIRNENLAGDDLQPVLIAHLESDDFFFTTLFPRAVFTILEGVPLVSATLTSPNYRIQGHLELRGAKADLEFEATVNRLADGRLAAEAHFDIDRTRWNVFYGSSRFFDQLGMHLVFDRISLQLRVLTT